MRPTLKTLALITALLLVAGGAWAQDFTRYVAVGDSLTAGWASGGLHEDVQASSYPALLAAQAGAPDFQQPLAGAPGIPALLAVQSLGPGAPVIVPRSASPGAPLNLTLPRPYNNMAVPGFKVRDVLVTRTGNQIIDLILRGLGTQLELAVAQQPTFATVWIGNNDVLGAATSGRVIEGVTLTPVAQFRADYRAIVATLAGGGANLALATIPSVTALPFVGTIPPIVVDPATSRPVTIGGQLVPLIGPAGPLSMGDSVLLTASPLLGAGIGIPAQLGGTGQPLPDQVILSVAEKQQIIARTAAYNAIIGEAANDFGTALVDVAGIFDQILVDGYGVGGGIEYTTDFLTGGIFSYDGVHPTPFGYALVANAFIDAINARFGSSIDQVSLFPFVFGPQGAGGASLPAGASSAASVIFSKAASDSFFRWMRIRTAPQRRNGGPDNPGAGGPNPAGPGVTPQAPERPALEGPRPAGRARP